MTLLLADQHRLATTDDDLKNRTIAALFDVAKESFSASPLGDATQQAQRMALVNATINNPALYVQPFLWVIVTAPALATVDDLTDTFILATATAVFDIFANLLYPATIGRAT